MPSPVVDTSHMPSTELHALSATQLAELLARKETSAEEIVKALHARADKTEPKVGAFAHQFRQRALAAAREADSRRARGELLGPLDGLPLTVKESVDTKGTPTTCGMRAWGSHTAVDDAVVVSAARRGGAIILGKTNVPQTLMIPMETTNALFGTTYNPWSHEHGPGGSSGGEAAAHASGSSPMGFGTDIGGSGRIPAAFCGTCGLKPTHGRWSNVGSRGPLEGQELVKAQVSPMARDVDDIVLLMSALDPRAMACEDPETIPLAPVSDEGVDATRLRIGFYDDDAVLTPASSVRRAVRTAMHMLEDAGCKVERFTPPNTAEITWTYFKGMTADGLESLDATLDGEPVVPPLKTLDRIGHMPPMARAGLARTLHLVGEQRAAMLIESVGKRSVKELWDLHALRTQYIQEEHAAWTRAGIDILIAPAFATTAAPIGLAHDFTLGFAAASRYNFLDRPAGVVPISRVRPDETKRSVARDRLERRAQQIELASAGLPLGVQVVGRPWREDQVLAVMKLLQDRARQSDEFPQTPIDPD